MNMTFNLAGILGFGLLLALAVTAVIVVVVIVFSRKSDSADNAQAVQPTPMPVQAAPTEVTEMMCESVEKAPSQPLTLGEVIKSHRLRCGMTQEYVAEALEVTRQAVSKWETDSSDPSTSNLLALAKLFGVSPAELLEGLDE